MTRREERREQVAAALARHDGYLWLDDAGERYGVFADFDAYRRRADVALDAAGYVDPGPNPDLIDGDGDRWWECVPGGYSMDVYRSEVPTGSAAHRPIERSAIETVTGQLIEVPRCLDRGPVRLGAARHEAVTRR